MKRSSVAMMPMDVIDHYARDQIFMVPRRAWVHFKLTEPREFLTKLALTTIREEDIDKPWKPGHELYARCKDMYLAECVLHAELQTGFALPDYDGEILDVLGLDFIETKCGVLFDPREDGDGVAISVPVVTPGGRDEPDSHDLEEVDVDSSFCGAAHCLVKYLVDARLGDLLQGESEFLDRRVEIMFEREGAFRGAP